MCLNLIKLREIFLLRKKNIYFSFYNRRKKKQIKFYTNLNFLLNNMNYLSVTQIRINMINIDVLDFFIRKIIKFIKTFNKIMYSNVIY